MDAKTLSLRRRGIGGSEAGVVLGLDPHRSPMELYLEKIGELERDPIPERYSYWGHAHELAILERVLHDDPGLTIVHRPFDEPVAAQDAPFMLGLPDAIAFRDCAEQGVFEGPEAYEVAFHDGVPVFGIEVKTSQSWSSWGGDEVPPQYLAQCYHYSHIMNLPWKLAVLVGLYDYHLYDVPIDVEAERLLVEREREFWGHVERREPPPIEADGSEATDRAIRAAFPEAGDAEVALDLMEERLQELAALKEAKKRLETDIRRIEQEVKLALGEAHLGTTSSGWRVTFADATRTQVDAKRLAEEMPDVFQRFSKETSYRVLRVTPPKEGD